MQFIVNGVIRSLTNEEKNNELKQLLLGKKIKKEKELEFLITDLILTTHSVIFYGDHDSFFIEKVKKIEIDNKDNLIRIFNNANRYIISTI